VSGGPLSARVLFEGDAEPSAAPPGARVTWRAASVDGEVVAAAASRAWYWPEASATIERHRAHALVELVAQVGTPLESALALTEATAAIAARPGAIAVLWDATELVHEAAQWIAQTEDASIEDLPLFLWLAFEGTEDEESGTRSLRTRGARDLGAPHEIEVARSKRDGEELLEAVCDVALVVLTSDVPLEDNDQVEITRGKVRIRVEPSLANDGSKAYRLRLA
jgi:hypothetical protein